LLPLIRSLLPHENAIGSPVAQIHAKVFHHPANHPQILPYLDPGVTDAQ